MNYLIKEKLELERYKNFTEELKRLWKMSDSNGLAFWHAWINPKEQKVWKNQNHPETSITKISLDNKTFSAVRFFCHLIFSNNPQWENTIIIKTRLKISI